MKNDNSEQDFSKVEGASADGGIASYEKLAEEEIVEHDFVVRTYRHRKTGAQIVSVVNDDINNVFCISFRTPPTDSTGIFHIIEHSVLCGSKHFPLKDPFKEFLTGSVNTFLNAFTASDHTSYPFATISDVEYEQLMRVYLDAVFFPFLTPSTFKQEAWHYDLRHEDGPLTTRGVVLNEMRGYYQRPDTIFYQESKRAIASDGTFSHDSGGDPFIIPDLTYEGFREGHRRHYHPSNSIIYLYGSVPDEQKLAVLAEYLDQFQLASSPVIEGPKQQLLEPVRVEIPFDPMKPELTGRDGAVTINWRLPPHRDEDMHRRWEVIEALLVGDDAAPLKKALLESGYGEQVFLAGINPSIDPPTFHIGLRGIQTQDAEKIEAVVLKVLHDVVENGFDREFLASRLNSMEFHLREADPGTSPRGMLFQDQVIDAFMRGRNVTRGLRWIESFEQIAKDCAGEHRPLREIIRDGLIDNPQRVSVVFQPQIGLMQERYEAQAERYREIFEKLSSREKQDLIAESWELERLQGAANPDEAKASITHLTPGNLPREQRTTAFDWDDIGGLQVVRPRVWTPGIAYYTATFPLEVLSEELIPYVSLYQRVFSALGSADRSFESLLSAIRRETGGISVSPILTTEYDTGTPVMRLGLYARALVEKFPTMIALLEELIHRPNLADSPRLRQILPEMAMRFQNAVLSSPTGFVARRLVAPFDLGNEVDDRMSGISQRNFYRELAEGNEEAIEGVVQKLQTIHERIFQRRDFIGSLTTDPTSAQRCIGELGRFHASLPDESVPNELSLTMSVPDDQGIVVPGGVHYVGLAGKFSGGSFVFDESAHVLAAYVNRWLWDEVRVKGGAYGSRMSIDPATKIVQFLSWQDPHVERTLATYARASEHLRDRRQVQEELSNHVVRIVGNLDRPLSIKSESDRVLGQVLRKLSAKRRQELRDAIFTIQPEQFTEFAQVLEGMSMRCVVMGSRERLENVRGPSNKQLTLLS